MVYLRRAAALLIIILGCTGVLVSTSGIIGTWVAYGPVTTSTLQVLTTVEDALQITNTGISRLNSLLDELRGEVAAVQTTLQTVADESAAQLDELDNAEATLDDDLFPRLAALEQAVRDLQTAAASIRSAAEVLNTIPGFELEPPETTGLQELADGIAELRTNMQLVRIRIAELRTQVIYEVATNLDTVAAAVDNRLATVQNRLQELQSTLTVYETRITRLTATITALQRDVPGWINLGATGITLVLLWLIASQIFAIRYGWTMLRDISPATNDP